MRLRIPDMNRWTPTVEFNYRNTHDLEGGRVMGGVWGGGREEGVM